jgi:hypothetical protein
VYALILAEIEGGQLESALERADALIATDRANHDFRVLRARVLNRVVSL